MKAPTKAALDSSAKAAVACDDFKASTKVHMARTKKALTASRDATGDARATASEARERVKADRSLHEALGENEKGDRAPKMTQAEQGAEFERVAKEHGAEGSEAEFNGALRKLAKPRETG